MKHYLILLVALSLWGLPACHKKKGCTDVHALNYDPDAEENNGSCQYSSVTFYAEYGVYDGIPITSIDVYVNNSLTGTINYVYPNGPGDCGAQGTVFFSFPDGSPCTWNTNVHLANGATITGAAGTIIPSALSCIKVNVTI